ncbi:aminotransferase class I/II-fold pyridoxal phosphate-dependent enzyme [Aciduricibacillus chroicocephali]|uniref:Aminotransferase class I/II-fold pyridoxal phosphate-dependent enzyme n=1 Tax=Aciduricibacillus chroicocephali TaxID=3054939 RepID=A0ABY9KV77_9BACI|nr:aminotransferase class I/II-fold pyridoxal phosphate-dependent enzyme [Bacillaceae bacterium 44XB]
MRNSYETPLFDKLKDFAGQNPISLHVPGHKSGAVFPEKGREFYQRILPIDLTEVTGLDDLHAPEGAILEAEKAAAEFFKADRSFFLVGGSTAGNLAMILGTVRRGERIIVQRNCHKSVMNGIELAGALPVFIAPEFDEQVRRYTHPSKETLAVSLEKYPDAKAVLLTYPDYFGGTYPLQEMIELSHEKGIPVLVDEAHGVHFALGQPLPPSALCCGADIVVQSAHKMAPAMTMASYLHMQGNLVSEKSVARFLQMIQSSSPSYPIMASLDLARSFLETMTGEELNRALESSEEMRKEMRKLDFCSVVEAEGHDPFKITLQMEKGWNGLEAIHAFERAGLWPELATEDQVLFIAGLAPQKRFDKFIKALSYVNEQLKKAGNHATIERVQLFPDKIRELAFTYEEMNTRSHIEVPFAEAAGLIAAEAVIPYPPGIPLIMRGERIEEVQLKALDRLIRNGARLQQRHETGNLLVFTN